MNTMDRRIAERRHHVTEERARGRLRWLLWVVLAVGAVAVTVWLFNSPLLSVRAVTVTGAHHTDPVSIAASLAVAPGTPTMSVNEGEVESALLAEPWIATADVIVSWPGNVEIRVVERLPGAVISIGGAHFQTSTDGVLVESAREGAIPPLITTDDSMEARVGDRIADGPTLGAIAFVAALPPSLQRSTRVTVAGGVVGAEVDGIVVVIGRPTDMEAKAAAVGALVNMGLEPGSRLDVTAPLSPAVAPPRSQLEGETKTLEESQPSD